MDISSPPSIYAPAETIVDRILAVCRVVIILPVVFVLDCWAGEPDGLRDGWS
jgi:hypothetical protein